MRLIWKQVAIVFGVLVVIVAAAGYLFVRGADEVAHTDFGMVELSLPTGGMVFVRRQGLYGQRAELFVSPVGDYCMPYKQSVDYKLSEPVHGAADSPLIISYEGNTIVVHAPNRFEMPRRSSSLFEMRLAEMSLGDYFAYARAERALPPGWQRVEVPFGHNTCSL